MPLLELVNIRLALQEKTILDELSFQVDSGDIIGLLGTSGSGKTSLFRMINLLQSPTQGTVLYRGKDTLTYQPTTLRREIGYVFQKTYLFGDTIKENLIYPYQLLKQEPDFQEITDYLAKANLPQDIITKKINELSGGEQQRIALIRSLLVKPHILLLDEVTASLDEENTLIIEKLILDQHQTRNVTILFISHNTQQAERLAQKILYLAKGRISFYGNKGEFFERGLNNE
ncbi:putative iron export ATP-binding protein FetA [bioreactor metagenome]|uniref:Putative iron export ATP-binding protein FetA n=1 Tax=bioreactor metagenome TaxID=1076179 RepID=A0A644TMC8_9ZZZZ|nr:ATP-binding cassette domain-containing protein [Negativicutes bacterium]